MSLLGHAAADRLSIGQRIEGLAALRPWRSPQLVLFVSASAVFVAWSVVQVLNHLPWLLDGAPAADWFNLLAVDPAQPFADTAFAWSPPAAWIWHYLVAPLGLTLWRLLHLAALLLIRDRLVIAAALLTFPFWIDVMNGNNVTFMFVAAWFALQGRRSGVIAFCVLAALVPRPIMVPTLAVLLWRRTDARWAFGLAAAAVIGFSLATGQLDDWVARLASTPANEMQQAWNKGPSRIIGPIWIPIGLVLGAIATVTGWIGAASLLIAPYLTHYYILMGFLDLPRLRGIILRSLERRPAEPVVA